MTATPRARATNRKRKLLEASVLRHMTLASEQPMVWGNDDCGLWFANIIRDALGYDPGARWRGSYETREGAATALGKPGLVFWGNAMAEHFGWSRIDSSEAVVGDVGFFKMVTPGNAPFVSVVVCRSPGWFVGRNETGFTAIPASRVRAVSRVV